MCSLMKKLSGISLDGAWDLLLIGDFVMTGSIQNQKSKNNIIFASENTMLDTYPILFISLCVSKKPRYIEGTVKNIDGVNKNNKPLE